MKKNFKTLLKEVSNLPNYANVFKNFGRAAVYDQDGYLNIAPKAPGLGKASTIKRAPLYYKSFADFRKAAEKEKNKDITSLKGKQVSSLLNKTKSETDPFVLVTNGKSKIIIAKQELQMYLNKGYKKI